VEPSTPPASGGDGGKLIKWSSDGVDEVCELSEPASPRSLAARPNEPWVAIGMKQGDFVDPQAVALILDVR
jgi:hypothetical protein